MTDAIYSPEQWEFLSHFFGPGNTLRWDAYCSEAMSTSSRELLAPLVADYLDDSVAVLLPRVRESNPPTVEWYALARNSRQSRSLKEQLSAFIGPTFTDFTGQYASLDGTDPIERAVSDAFSPFVFRLRVVNHADRNEVRNQILLLRSFRDIHLDRATNAVRPIGRLLRDLEMSLVVRNIDTAWRYFDELRSRGRLSAHNLTFLKVRILATFGRWSDLLELPEWSSLTTIRRPARVTQGLLKAVYEAHFAEFENNQDIGGCVARFRELQPSFGTLFRARGELHDPATLKAFLIRSVAEREIRLDAMDAIVNVFNSYHERDAWVEQLAVFARAQVTTTSADGVHTEAERIDASRAACDLGDYDAAFANLLECKPSIVVVRQLLACSYEIDTLEASRRTMAFMEACPKDIRNDALSMRASRHIWDALTQEVVSDESSFTAEAIPDGWIAWIERLNNQGAWPAAAEIARHGSLEWGSGTFRGDVSKVSHFAELLLSNRSSDADIILKNAVPELLTAFLPDGEPIRDFKLIYLHLAYVLALDSSIGSDDLVALSSLTESILQCAPTKSAQSNEFNDLLETLEAAWAHIAATKYVDWALQILDILIAFNVAQHAPVDRFLFQIGNRFREWTRRIRVDQWHFLDQLAKDLGQSQWLADILPVADDLQSTPRSLFERLKGQTVAIYTLTERLGRRAAEVLNERFEGVKISLIHDKKSSDRLVQLARNADIFVVNTWDATHAATNAIQANRPKTCITLFPQSKSAGSVVREIYDYLDSTTTD